MYTDKITTDDKIVSAVLLEDIFSKMNEDIITYKTQYEQEKIYNEKLSYEYQKWTIKDFSSNLSFDVDFYDKTSAKIDNYEKFIDIFHSRLEEIKSINCYYRLSYNRRLSKDDDQWFHQSISIYINEKKCEFEFSLSSEDNKMENIYHLIKEKITGAPARYDDIIKNKSKIMNKVSLAIGLIPGIAISTILLFLPIIGEIVKKGFIVFPSLCVIIGFTLGMFFNSRIQSLYDHVIKDKKYMGYDLDKHKSVYSDDINKFKSEAEVLIGQNANNMKYREEIKKIEKKYSDYLPIEIVIILLLTLVFIVIFNLIGL